MRKAIVPSGSALMPTLDLLGLDPADPSLCFILPDIPAVAQAEALLAPRGVLGRRLLTFGSLAEAVNDSLAGLSPISRMGRLFIMEEVVEGLGGDMSYFRDISSPGGFSEAVIRIITELKHSGVSHAELAASAAGTALHPLRDKLADLALIFRHYEAALARDGSGDDIDLLRLAAERIPGGVLRGLLPDAARFVVFGFSEFTPSQLGVIAGLEKAGYEVTLALPDLAAFPGLEHRLRESLAGRFGGKTERLAGGTKGPRTVEIDSFGSARDQAFWVARKIKDLVLEGGVGPDDIAVIVHKGSQGISYLSAELRRHGIPFSLPRVWPLGSQPLARLALDLLRLRAQGYPRALLMHTIRSPFLSGFFGDGWSPDPHCAELLRVSLESSTAPSFEHWKEALRGCSDGGFSAKVGDLLKELDGVQGSGTLPELIGGWARLLGGLRVHDAVAALGAGDPQHPTCWQGLESLLRELGSLAEGMFPATVYTLGDFIRLCGELLEEESVSYRIPRRSPEDSKGSRTDPPRVSVLLSYSSRDSARGTGFPHVFVFDAGEKAYPAPAPPDPVFKPDERERINEALRTVALTVEDHHIEREEHLFRSVCESATGGLYVTWSHTDEGGRTQLPSYLVERLAAEHGIEVRRRGFGELFAEPGMVFDLPHLAALAHYSGCQGSEPMMGYLSAGLPWFADVQQGILAEGERMRPEGEYSVYEGVLPAGTDVPVRMPLSPTRLEAFGTCPFKFFAESVLGLKSVEEEDLSLLTLGDIYHGLMEGLFAGLSTEMGGPVDLRGVEDSVLIERCLEALDGMDLGARLPLLSPTVLALVKKRLSTQTLPGFIASEAERTRAWNERGFFPRYFEKDVRFTLDALELRGFIDRVDTSARKEAVVVDYKLSGTDRRFVSHKNLQLPLYLMALEQEGYKPAGGFYRFIEKPDEEKGSEAPEAALELAAEYVRRYAGLMDGGFFPPVVADKNPDFDREVQQLARDERGPCKWCDFTELCRADYGARRKPR